MSQVEVSELHTLRTLLSYANDLFNQLVESGGELTPALEEKLNNLEISIPDKVEAYNYVMDRFEAEAQLFKQKAEFYSVLMRGCLRAKERIKDNLKFAMHEAGLDEIKGKDIRFKLLNTKPALVIKDAEVEDVYRVQLIETVVDRKRIEEDLKLGIPVRGAHLVPSFALRVYANKKDE